MQTADQEFIRTMEQESIALEDNFSSLVNEYHSTHIALNKSWYSIALESNDADQQKDNANKSDIIRRMIDTIVGFIKRILKKIKDFFIVDPETIKQQQEFAKNYKGPTQDQKAQASNQQGSKKDNSNQGHGQPHGAQQGHQSNHTAKWDEKLALVAAMLGKDRLAIIAALLSNKSDLLDNFEKGLVAAGKILKDVTFDNHGTIGDELNYRIKACRDEIDEASGWSDKEQRDILNGWVSGTNLSAASRIVAIYDATGPDSALHLPQSLSKYLEQLEKNVESMKNSTEPEVVQKLKDEQKLVYEISAFISLMARIQSAYSTTIKGLNK